VAETLLDKDLRPSAIAEDTSGIYPPLDMQAELEAGSALAAQVTRYVGKERREQLDQEIERLYRQVEATLSDNQEAVAFALKTLREAQDLVFEKPYEYDQALYLVAHVRSMLIRRQNLGRWSYSWGIFVLCYAVIWLIALISGVGYLIWLALAGTTPQSAVVLPVLFSGLAGGIGGVVDVLWVLYFRSSSVFWPVTVKKLFLI
jgi:hypothetical protein